MILAKLNNNLGEAEYIPDRLIGKGIDPLSPAPFYGLTVTAIVIVAVLIFLFLATAITRYWAVKEEIEKFSKDQLQNDNSITATADPANSFFSLLAKLQKPMEQGFIPGVELRQKCIKHVFVVQGETGEYGQPIIDWKRATDYCITKVALRFLEAAANLPKEDWCKQLSLLEKNCIKAVNHERSEKVINIPRLLRSICVPPLRQKRAADQGKQANIIQGSGKSDHDHALDKFNQTHSVPPPLHLSL